MVLELVALEDQVSTMHVCLMYRTTPLTAVGYSIGNNVRVLSRILSLWEKILKGMVGREL